MTTAFARFVFFYAAVLKNLHCFGKNCTIFVINFLNAYGNKIVACVLSITKANKMISQAKL